MHLSFGLLLDWQSSGLFFGVALANTAFGDPLVAFLHDRGITSVDLLAANNDGFTTCVCARRPCLNACALVHVMSRMHTAPLPPLLLWLLVSLRSALVKLARSSGCIGSTRLSPPHPSDL